MKSKAGLLRARLPTAAAAAAVHNRVLEDVLCVYVLHVYDDVPICSPGSYFVDYFICTFTVLPIPNLVLWIRRLLNH